MKKSRRGRQEHTMQLDNQWNVKSHDFDDLNYSSLPSSDERNLDFPPITLSDFILNSSKSSLKGENSKGFSRNRHNYGVETSSIEKLEVFSSDPKMEVMSEDEDRITDVYATESNSESIEQLHDTSDSLNDIDVVLRRLQELRLGAEEPELSEQQLKINDQLQQDELLAMEAIYGESALVLDKKEDLRSFQININIESSDELIISANLNSSSEMLNSGTKAGGTQTGIGGSDFLYTFKVQYLPPIVLTCYLPKSYPSHRPPFFTISVQWLASVRISSLCCMLDSIWIDQPGQEVIYQWVEWLHSSSLSYLGFDEGIILGPYDMQDTEDSRAVSRSTSPDIDIPSLISYNDEKSRDVFRKTLHECCICFSEYAGAEFIVLPCQHFFCWKCMKTYSNMHVKEGTINKLLCPDSKCEGLVPPGFLKKLLGDDEFERWESLLLQKTLDSMVDVAYCPRCETACLEDDEQHAQCPKCFFSFCTLCREHRHVGIACLTPELKLRVLQERQNSSHLKDDQKRREREMINEILSVKEVLRDAKQCPSCKIAISRIEGCNKMVCNNCGQFFCYRCNEAIDGYDHYRGGTCELFPLQMIREWQEQLHNRQEQMNDPWLLGLERDVVFADPAQLCPNCGQENAKVGNNNHIFCWSCHCHYCYLCRKTVRRGSQHFGPKGCKQHTQG